MELNKEYQQQLRQGLDLMNFDLIRVLPQKPRVAAVILRSKRPDQEHLWCVQHLDTRWYFDTFTQTIDYCKKRGWTHPANLKK